MMNFDNLIIELHAKKDKINEKRHIKYQIILLDHIEI
jgi:hypothetical protein